MSTIILKGTDRKLECTISVCERINKLKEEKADPRTPLNISGSVIELGDIRYAIKDGELDKELNRDEKKNNNGVDIEKINKEFNKEIYSYANGTLEKKLQFNLKIAKFYCLALTGEKIDSYKDKLKPIFLEELQKEKLVVNPTKYLKLFVVKEIEGKQGLTKIDYLVRTAPLKIMENYLSNVYSTLKYIK